LCNCKKDLGKVTFRKKVANLNGEGIKEHPSNIKPLEVPNCCLGRWGQLAVSIDADRGRALLKG
jgi:hypothetical protein